MKNILYIILFIFSFSTFLFSDTILLHIEHGPFFKEEKQINNADFLGVSNNKVFFKINQSEDFYFLKLKLINKILDNNNLEIDYKNKIFKNEFIPPNISLTNYLTPEKKDKKKKNRKKRFRRNKKESFSQDDIFYSNDLELFSDWSYESKNIFYQTEKISPEHALIYQWLSPLPFMNLGYAYSDNWSRGLMWDLGSIICLAAYNEAEKNANDYENKSSSDSALFAVGFLAISIYKIIDVYIQAEKYNDNLYNTLFNGNRPTFSIQHSPKNNEFRLAVSYPIK